MLLITVQRGSDPPSEHRFASGPVRVGRESGNELVLDDESVFRHHATFEERDGAVVLVDNSLNATLINQKPFDDEQRVTPADVVTIGAFTLRATSAASEDTSPRDPPTRPDAKVGDTSALADTYRDEGLSLGQVLNLPGEDSRHQRYRVKGALGSGGVGDVLLGYDTTLQREVAIKIMSQVTEHDATVRFEREARALAKLNHANILQVIDYAAFDDGKSFIVTERLTGRTLEELVQRGPLAESIACAIGAELAAGLAHAHAAGVVHRDVKPENVLLEPNGRVVLIDFGLVTSFAEGEDANRTSTQLLGTADFTNPEQCLGKTAIPKSDLFSLGSLLYYIASGETPFKGDSFLALLTQVTKAPHVPLVNHGASPAFSALVDRLLEKDPDARVADAEALERALRELLGENHVYDAPALLRRYAATWDEPAPEKTRIVARDDNQRRNISLGEQDEILAPAGKAEVPAPRPAAERTNIITAPAASRKRRPVGLIALLAAVFAICASALFIMSRAPPREVQIVEPIATPAAPPAVAPLVAAPLVAAPISVQLFVIPWATVLVDGELAGTTPTLRRVMLTPGSHELTFRHPSYGEQKRHFDAGPDSPSELHVDLRRR